MIADPGITATFSNLPTEMKATIFGYVRQNDHRKSACLVSRGWRDIMAPILWERFTLRIGTTLPGELSCLLNPDNGVLAYVYSIDIRTDLGCLKEIDMNSSFGVAFKLIIGALPRNRLSSIRLYTAINTDTLLFLLQSQQALRTLQINQMNLTTSVSISPSLGIYGSWITPTLYNIRKLVIPVVCREYAYENNAFLLKNTPKLKILGLNGLTLATTFLHDSHGRDALGGPRAAAQPLQLDRFHLYWLNLGTYPASLFTVIDFSILHELCITQCCKIGAFLTALVPGASQVPALRKLEIVIASSSTPSDATIQDIETLVASMSSLQSLWLDVAKGRAIDIACLAEHGSSLTRLGLAASSGTPTLHYCSSELDNLLTQAPKLVSLAINLCPINLDHIRYLGAKFILFKRTGNDYVLSELESLLVRK
jgi:hypothetical protein